MHSSLQQGHLSFNRKRGAQPSQPYIEYRYNIHCLLDIVFIINIGMYTYYSLISYYILIIIIQIHNQYDSHAYSIQENKSYIPNILLDLLIHINSLGI